VSEKGRKKKVGKKCEWRVSERKREKERKEKGERSE
jgi:hypothetical protein